MVEIIKNNNFTNATQLNPEENTTMINDISMITATLPKGYVFCGKYIVSEKLKVTSGEADLYLCTYKRKKYVAKVYRRPFAIKKEVAERLKQIDSPFVSPLYETGTVNNMPFEILPYYKNGSFKGRKFTFEELKNNIIPCINEALRELHSKEIIHKDLKPSNIMLNDDGKSVSVIDFGISSALEDGRTVVMTRIGMTPEYSAPETFRSLYLEESDYYSFGVAICEIFCGCSPYADMSFDEIARFVSLQKIPLPPDMPAELSDIVNALTYYDITNRNDKTNPNRRWTYDEVKKWCEGINQPLPGKGIYNSEKPQKTYDFKGKEFIDTDRLIIELATFWEEGKKELFRGTLSSYFADISNQKAARICYEAEEEVKLHPENENSIFWKVLYTLSPNLQAFFWKGSRFDSISSFGLSVLEKLWNNENTDYGFYNSILQDRLLSEYVALKFPLDKELKDTALLIENIFRIYPVKTPEKIYYTMAYILSGCKILKIGEKEFSSIRELAGYMKSLLNSSQEDFNNFCLKLCDYNNNLDIQFECWLTALGKSEAIKQWKADLKG